MSISRTAASWPTGSLPTGAKLNAEIKALWDGLQAPWDSYTPTWGASTAPVLNNGSLVGAYLRIGNTIAGWRVTLTIGSSTTFGSGQWYFAMPATPGYRYSCNVEYYDVSAPAVYTGTARTFTGSNALVYAPSTTAGAGDRSLSGSGVPFTWAAGDVLTISGSPYEIT